MNWAPGGSSRIRLQLVLVIKQVVVEQIFLEESRNGNQAQPKGDAAVMVQRKQEFGPESLKFYDIPE